MRHKMLLVVWLVATLFTCTSLACAGVLPIFQDSFDRGSESVPELLNGSVPDVRPGSETWIAPGAFATDGSVLTPGSGGKAYVAFTPTANKVYTLKVTADPADSGVDTDWISLGFASTMDGNPWDNVGPWMLYRGNGQVTAFYNGLNGRENVIAAGSTTAARELAIVLDTTSALWRAEWLVDGTSVRTYAYTANPTINYVQLGGNAGMTNVSTFDNFSLSYVPEPSTWLASVCGVVVVAFRRRRR